MYGFSRAPLFVLVMYMQDTTSARTPARLSFDKLSLIALIATLALAFLAVTFSPNFSFLGTKTFLIMLGAIIAFALFVIARLTRGNIIIPPSFLLIAVWFVPGAYALSTLFSGVNPAIAFAGIEFEPQTLGFMVTLAVVASLFALALRRESDYGFFFSWVSRIALLALLVQAGLILVALFSPATVAPLSNLIGSFSDMGMLTGLGVLGGLMALRFLTLPKIARMLAIVGVVLGFVMLAIVNSSLLWLLICAVSLALLVEALMRRQMPSVDEDLEGVRSVAFESESSSEERRPIGLPVVTLVVALFFLIGGGTIGNAISSAFGASFIDVRPSWQATFDIGSHTLASSPLFGSGPGTFGEQWLMHRDRALNDTIFWNVDFSSGIGFIPTSMVTTGVVGIIAWLAFIGVFAFAGLRTLLLRLPQGRLARFTSIFSFLGASYVLVLAIFSTPGPVVLLAGFALLGVFISSTRFGKDKVELGVIFSRNPRLGFVVVFLLTLLLIATVYAAYAITVRYLSSVAYGEAVVALSEGDMAGAESAVMRSLSFGETDRTYRLASAIGVARMNEIATSETLAPSDAQTQFQSALANSVQAALAATQIAPKNYQNWLALGGVYQSVVPLEIEGAATEAEAAYVRAQDLAPSNPVIAFTLAQLDIIAEDYASAETRLLEAVALKRDYTQAILMYSQLQVQLGKAEEALQAVEAAIYFAPNDTATLFQAGLLRLGTNNRAGAIQALARAVELNPGYANARFFLAVAHAGGGDFASAITELEAVSALSEENATAVSADLASLREGTNPYPLSRLRTLGIPYPPVEEPELSTEDIEAVE